MKLLIVLVLLVFGAFNTFVAGQEGYWSVFPPFASWSQTQMFVDLAVALTLFNIWMCFDWRRSGRPLYQLIPFLVAPLLVGSIGPLLYLLFREFTRSSASERDV